MPAGGLRRPARKGTLAHSARRKLRENADVRHRSQCRARKARARPIVVGCRHSHDPQRRDREGDGRGRLRLVVSRHGAWCDVARSLRADRDRRPRRRHRPDRAGPERGVCDRDARPGQWRPRHRDAACRYRRRGARGRQPAQISAGRPSLDGRDRAALRIALGKLERGCERTERREPDGRDAGDADRDRQRRGDRRGPRGQRSC